MDNQITQLQLENIRLKKAIIQLQSRLAQLDWESLTRDEQKLIEETAGPEATDGTDSLQS